jgi:hypothetical protein
MEKEWLPIPVFVNQHKVIMLLLWFGIGPLSRDLVKHILQKYVYVKPHFQIGSECRKIDFFCKCVHSKFNNKCSIGWYTAEEIILFFKENDLEIPDHFKIGK